MSQTDPSRAPRRRKQPTVPFFYPDWLLLREIAAHVRTSLDNVGKGRLLDLGCGEKPFKVYAPADVTEWIGYDVPENAVADFHGYANALPFEDDSFDSILCTEVLEHVPDPATALREMARVSRPGGYLILTTPQYFPLHEEPHDFFRYTPYGLRYLLEGAGFEVIEAKPITTGFNLVAVAVNTCFNDFGKGLPGGRTWLGRAVFAPIYAATNVFACVLSRLVPAPKNAVGTAVLARRLDRGLVAGSRQRGPKAE